MTYYSKENVVYTDNGEVACVIAPVLLLKGVANRVAAKIAKELTDFYTHDCDVLRGSLD